MNPEWVEALNRERLEYYAERLTKLRKAQQKAAGH